jgi:hypothetical protein
MKKTALAFGLLSGALAVALMLASLPFIRSMALGTSDLIGYTSIVISALVLFFGIRSHRERAGGRLTFGRGLGVGILISLISSACYMAAFQVVYFKAMPDFGEKFSACMLERARASGATEREIEETAAMAAALKRLYDHPATNAALTFATTFPVGFVMSVLAAAVLRTKGR